MNTIIDIYNKTLSYNNNEINFEIDIDGVIWFKFLSIAKILGYKSTKDVIRDHIDKKYKKSIKNIKLQNPKKNNQPDMIYITENGLYSLLIKSKMKKAVEFQLWLINDALPNLRKYGKYEVDKKTQEKLDDLNKTIKLLTKSNKQLKKNMTNKKYPVGYHFYVLKEDGMYKIGYTKNLKKRLEVYNTGKANKAEYSYYKKTHCAKEIEGCMKSLLNKYIYKSNKEFYNCSLNKILKELKTCLKLENECNKCKDIKNNLEQIGGMNKTITDILLEKYQNDYEKLINKIKKI